jgi:hypothetical protein
MRRHGALAEELGGVEGGVCVRVCTPVRELGRVHAFQVLHGKGTLQVKSVLKIVKNKKIKCFQHLNGNNVIKNRLIMQIQLCSLPATISSGGKGPMWSDSVRKHVTGQGRGGQGD